MTADVDPDTAIQWPHRTVFAAGIMSDRDLSA